MVTAMMRRLVTIPISHYCERARWALDWAGLDYREERHLQVFHIRAVKRAGGRRTVPVLVADGEVLTDSADIVAYAAARGARPLYPEDPVRRGEVEDLERELAGDFGVEVRRLAYFELMPHQRLLLKSNNAGAPLWQRIALRLAFPAMKRRVSKHLGIEADKVARGEVLLRETFDRVAERIADGRPYLFGDDFTAADLTFAALSAPMTLPREYGCPLPRPSDLPLALRTRLSSFRDHPAGQFALRLFADHRNREHRGYDLPS
jgi:glutathione S-transferase